ncbi:hypothetical protein LJR232_003655 [Aquipseudomonas alcaligenes]
MNAYFKPLCAFVLAALCSIAQAATLLPPSTPFTAYGMFTLQSGTIPTTTCNISLSGTTGTSNTASITTVSITGTGFCPAITASWLTWTWTATSTTAATLSGVKLLVQGKSCTISSATLNGSWSNASNTLSFSPNQFFGDCILGNLRFSPSPMFTVVP